VIAASRLSDEMVPSRHGSYSNGSVSGEVLRVESKPD